MNWVDLVVLGSLAGGLWTGYRRGALMQAFSWGGFVIGLFLGGILAPRIVGLIDPKSPVGKATLSMGVFLGVAFVAEALLSVLGHRFRRKIRAPWAHNVDRAIGSVVAMTLSLVAAWFLGVTLKQGPSEQIAASIKGSAILRALDGFAPRPPGFFAEIGRFLNHTGFPEVFAQLNPSLAPGVESPPASLAKEPKILAAAELTYKIESPGCGGLVDGSGFPVDRQHVFTAAHVVAGTHDTKVIQPDGHSYSAKVIYIDTQKDIAILLVTSLPKGNLSIDLDAAPRGTDGAAIGYPGGGPRRTTPARVRARTEALGRDIYSRGLVEREIYVLRARVRRGNSGGPFVDADGRVRGLVFAAATDNPDESYALAESELAAALGTAKGRTDRVSTGRCAV